MTELFFMITEYLIKNPGGTLTTVAGISIVALAKYIFRLFFCIKSYLVKQYRDEKHKILSRDVEKNANEIMDIFLKTEEKIPSNLKKDKLTKFVSDKLIPIYKKRYGNISASIKSLILIIWKERVEKLRKINDLK